MTHSTNPDQPGQGTAIRLIFEYDGEDVRLISQHRVDVAITGFDLAHGSRPGNYVDVRDDGNATLARVPIRQGLAASAEVFPEQPGEPITRVDVDRPRGAFTVVVPAPETARRVAVVRVPPTPPTVVGGGATSPAPGEREAEEELASFSLEAGR